MTNLQRRLLKLEAQLTDVSGLVPHSKQWLQCWDRELHAYMVNPEKKWPKVLFPVEAVRALMNDPASLVCSIPAID